MCPPASGAHANCGLLVPSDATPLAAPGVLGQGLKWMLDSSSPFYIAPRPSAALARWLWLFRALLGRALARRLPSCARCTWRARACTTSSPPTTARLAVPPRRRAPGVRDGRGLAAAAEDVARARALGVRVGEWTVAQARRPFPGLRCVLAGAFFFPEDGHLDPMLFTRAVAARAPQAGATVVTGAEALSLEPRRAACAFGHERGAFDAGQVVLAAGAWTPFLTRARPPSAGQAGQGLQRRRRPAGGLPGAAAVPRRCTRGAHAAGRLAAVGSTLELAGWDMRVRPRRVAYLRTAGERAVGVPADEP